MLSWLLFALASSKILFCRKKSEKGHDLVLVVSTAAFYLKQLNIWGASIGKHPSSTFIYPHEWVWIWKRREQAHKGRAKLTALWRPAAHQFRRSREVEVFPTTGSLRFTAFVHITIVYSVFSLWCCCSFDSWCDFSMIKSQSLQLQFFAYNSRRLKSLLSQNLGIVQNRQCFCFVSLEGVRVASKR